MGLMTNVSILNDVIGEYGLSVAKKVEFFDLIYNQMCSSQAIEAAQHSGVVVNSVEHSSTTTIIAMGGNHSTVLGHTLASSHHTPEGQLAILKELADDLGYRITKKAK